MRSLLPLVLLAVFSLTTRAASAHGMRTAYVELREHDDGRVLVQVRTGSTYGAVRVVMPEICSMQGMEGATWTCTRPLRGATLRVEGLGALVGDAVIVVTLRDGETLSQLVRPGATSWDIPERATFGAVLTRYARAGFAHVFAGADHLLFLAALVVMLRRLRAVLVAETAFTLSHSVAFASTALGWIRFPPDAAEAAIALSLVLVALDIGRRGAAARAGGAGMALVFGAVHGLGFAGGLAELGVPRSAALPALVGFAAGVELAQIAFLLGCLLLVSLAARASLARPLSRVTTYAVGVTGSFWLFDRALPVVQSALR